MSRKNFKVDTAQEGQTAKTENKHPFVYKSLNIAENSKVPTGKVVTLEDKKKRREAREKQYRDFRMKALERRAKRMGLSEEETKKAAEKLMTQFDAPKNYNILLLYNKKDKNLVEQAILNNKLKWLMKSDEHMYIEGDAATLAVIREIAPPGTMIHPYPKKMEPVLPVKEHPKVMKKPIPKAERKNSCLKSANTGRRRHNIARLSKDNRRKFKTQVKTLRDLWKASKKPSATVVPNGKTNASEGLKKAA